MCKIHSVYSLIKNQNYGWKWNHVSDAVVAEKQSKKKEKIV